MSGRDHADNQLKNFLDSQKVQIRMTVFYSKSNSILSNVYVNDYVLIQGAAAPNLTTSGGSLIGNKLASLTVGPRGPILLQDHVLLDETAHFDRERIPERVVHAKGAGNYLHSSSV